MVRGVNKVILIGNLGKDPEVRYSPDGSAIANFSLATSESWKDKNTGETVEKTEWHRVVLFRRLAEIAGEYLKKGSKVFIEGKLKTRKWQDKEGVDRYITEIVARELQMLDSRGTNEQPQQDQHNQAKSNGYAPHSGEAGPPHAQQMPIEELPFDDEIPF